MKHCYFLKYNLRSSVTQEIISALYQACIMEDMDNVLNESSRFIAEWSDLNKLPVFNKVLSTGDMLSEMEALMDTIKLNHLRLCFEFFFK